MSTPSALLHNGMAMPIIGLGTWRSPADVVTQVIKDAIEMGYRRIDCAHIYDNEQQVGVALEEEFKNGTIEREALFVTSKLWNTFHEPNLVRSACETSLRNLRLKYLDLYLVHWPTAFKDGEELHPKDEEDRMLYSDVDYVDTWRAMEDLVDAGLCRAIGLSNFNKQQIMRIFNVAHIPPAVLQIECHPYLNQQRLMEFCHEKAIVVTAYSPLGSPHSPYEKCGEYPLMEHPKIVELAEKYTRNTAQILLRFQTQRGNIAIPRSITKSHMKANLHVFDFELSAEEMAELHGLDINGRFMDYAVATGHPHHPFEHDDF